MNPWLGAERGFLSDWGRVFLRLHHAMPAASRRPLRHHLPVTADEVIADLTAVPGVVAVTGHSPGAPPGDVDHAAADRVLPHPVYAAQSWVCVVSPGRGSEARLRRLLEQARARAEGATA